VARYQRPRAVEERRKAEALSADWNEFVIQLLQLYIAFVYDIIELGQRRAINEMLSACRAGDGEALRRRILDYLEQTEFSEALEEMLDDERAGIGMVDGLMEEVVSPNEAVRLRGPVARALETYPDHPGLLLLRALTEALARDTDELTVTQNFGAYLENARGAYGLPPELVTRGVASALRYVSRKDEDLAELIERTFLERGVDRDQVRFLIADCGFDSLHLAPWALLNETVDMLDDRQTVTLNG